MQAGMCMRAGKVEGVRLCLSTLWCMYCMLTARFSLGSSIQDHKIGGRVEEREGMVV